MLLPAAAEAPTPPIAFVAAENFYGDIARHIGGAEIAVTSILSNPDQDPHEFEASPSTARAFAAAAVVVYNGAGYDPWAEKLLAASSSTGRRIVCVAALVHREAADNPHLWYDPATMPALAETLAAIFAQLDPAQTADYRRRLVAFERSLVPLTAEIAELRSKYRGTAVAATEPVFGYMADALGLSMHDRHFQLATMNGTEPSAADIASFEQQLRTKAVKLLIYNAQTGDALTRRLRAIARHADVPVVGVTETEPTGKDYQEWMRSQLAAIGRALSR
jgi:zinc/manganese transport system substrate-binding protein